MSLSAMGRHRPQQCSLLPSTSPPLLTFPSAQTTPAFVRCCCIVRYILLPQNCTDGPTRPHRRQVKVRARKWEQSQDSEGAHTNVASERRHFDSNTFEWRQSQTILISADEKEGAATGKRLHSRPVRDGVQSAGRRRNMCTTALSHAPPCQAALTFVLSRCTHSPPPSLLRPDIITFFNATKRCPATTPLLVPVGRMRMRLYRCVRLQVHEPVGA